MEHEKEWARGYYNERSGQWYYCGQHARILRCTCGWAVEYKWDNEDDRPIFDSEPDKLPWIRLSHERELQQAVDSGITGSELLSIAQQYSGNHSWTWPPDAPISITRITIEQ
jgi:hypothetical protein